MRNTHIRISKNTQKQIKNYLEEQKQQRKLILTIFLSVLSVAIVALLVISFKL